MAFYSLLHSLVFSYVTSAPITPDDIVGGFFIIIALILIYRFGRLGQSNKTTTILPYKFATWDQQARENWIVEFLWQKYKPIYIPVEKQERHVSWIPYGHLDDIKNGTFTLVPMMPDLIDQFASPELFAELEHELGVSFPKLFHRLYCEIGNGKYGPDYGLYPIKPGSCDTRTLPASYFYMLDDAEEMRNEEPDYYWPFGVIPICEIGCGGFYCIDCTDANHRILYFNTSLPGNVPKDYFALASHSFEDWIIRWITEKQSENRYVQIYDPTTIGKLTFSDINPILDD